MFPWLKSRINAIKRRAEASKKKAEEKKKLAEQVARDSNPEVTLEAPA